MPTGRPPAVRIAAGGAAIALVVGLPVLIYLSSVSYTQMTLPTNSLV
jgi:hypothetical protein